MEEKSSHQRKSLRRQVDESNTLLVNDYLDKFVYTEENGFSNIKREDGVKAQVSGIDITFDFNGESFLCDEKAAAAYINNPLRTFSLELSFINKAGIEKIGWFVNDDLSTDSYVFVWIDEGDVIKVGEDKKGEIYALTGIDGIKKLEISFIRKEKIKEYLSSLGWTRDNLLEKNRRIRENNKEKMGKITENGCKFSYSKSLSEKSINVLVPRDKLIEMADKHLKFGY